MVGALVDLFFESRPPGGSPLLSSKQIINTPNMSAFAFSRGLAGSFLQQAEQLEEVSFGGAILLIIVIRYLFGWIRLLPSVSS